MRKRGLEDFLALDITILINHHESTDIKHFDVYMWLLTPAYGSKKECHTCSNYYA